MIRQNVAQIPADRRRRVRRQLWPIFFHIANKRCTQFLRCVLETLALLSLVRISLLFGENLGEIAAQRLMKCCFLMNLAHRAAKAIDVCGRGFNRVCPHPLQQIAIWIKTLAKSKYLAQPSPGEICELSKKHASRTVAIAKKGEIDRGVRK